MPFAIRIRRTRSHEVVKPAKKPSHVLPRSPVIDLNGPGRLRTAHILALCGISHSTLYTRLKAKAFPPPDGIDGRINFWNTRTIREYLHNSVAQS